LIPRTKENGAVHNVWKNAGMHRIAIVKASTKTKLLSKISFAYKNQLCEEMSFINTCGTHNYVSIPPYLIMEHNFKSI
jgi:hypothetical protein